MVGQRQSEDQQPLAKALQTREGLMVNRPRARVSIGMPVYNGEPFIEEALSSILSQTYSDFELIISDNASSDKTQEICEAYAAKDGRVRYYRNDANLGAAKNFNRVFEMAWGEYFKWAAADDALEPEFLSRCVELLDKDPTIILAYPRLRVMDDYRGTGLREGTMRYDRVDLQSPMAGERFRHMFFNVFPCVYPIFGLIRSDVLRQTPLIRPCIGADHCLLVDLIIGGRFGEVPEYLMRGRWHTESYGFMIQRTGREGSAQSEWFDPANKGRILLPHWRRLWEHFVSIMGSKEDLSEKVAMVTDLCRGANWRRERLREELGTAVRQTLNDRRMPITANWLAATVGTVFNAVMIVMQTLFRIFRWATKSRDSVST